MSSHRHTIRLASLLLLLTSLTACAHSPTRKSLEQAFAADPRLQNNPVTFSAPNNSSQPDQTTAQLPTDFPAEIPRYPNAQLQAVTPPTSQAGTSTGSNGTLTRWISSDPSNYIASFYQQQFQTNNWQIIQPQANTSGNTIQAKRNDLQVSVSIQPSTSLNAASPNQATVFTIQYAHTSDVATANNATASPTPTPTSTSQLAANAPVSSTSSSTSQSAANAPVSSTSGAETFSDLDQVPPEYQQYVKDLAALGALPLPSNDVKSDKANNGTQFNPNEIITREQYALWLFTANNKIHAANPAQQIHLASTNEQPIFQDVPASDPNFPVIQGLAEAGIIPSSLSGNNSAALFRPNAPLTREQMILWKVPLDIHKALPNASIDEVRQSWGFQDAARINPLALRAVLADFQNGDQSNIRRVFGYTTLFQPQKPVTRAQAAAALWYFGSQSDGLSAKDVLQTANQQQ